MIRRQKRDKRYFLLLEVLIAFALTVLALLPMLYPHYYLLQAQKKFAWEVDLDHLVNLAYADIVERLYRNEIPFSDLTSEREFPIDASFLQRIGEGDIPYTGTYTFSEKIHKPKGNEPAPYSLHLINLDFKFQEKKSSDEKLVYRFVVFVVRDLASDNGSQGETS